MERNELFYGLSHFMSSNKVSVCLISYAAEGRGSLSDLLLYSFSMMNQLASGDTN